MNRVACLVMAAGAATRFYGIKQLSDINGSPMVVHVLRQLQALFTDDLYTVIGAYEAQVRPSVETLSKVIINAHWQLGLGHSIAKGVRAINQRAIYDGVMVVLADQVALTHYDFKRLLTEFTGRQIVAAKYQGHLGVPVIFPKQLFAQLSQLEGDQGARQVLQQNQDLLKAVTLSSAAIDIDTPQALTEFMACQHD